MILIMTNKVKDLIAVDISTIKHGFDEQKVEVNMFSWQQWQFQVNSSQNLAWWQGFPEFTKSFGKFQNNNMISYLFDYYTESI